jgi:DNA-binding beta-propeller fold protein YncE
MPDERRTRHEANLNQFWNALVQGSGARSADAGDLDPDTAQVLRELQVLGSAAAPAASRERVRTRVLATIQASPTFDTELLRDHPAMSDLPSSAVGPNGRSTMAVSIPSVTPTLAHAASRYRRFAVGHLATAALLLLSLAVSMLAVGVFRQRGEESVGVPAVLPAIQPSPVAFVWSTTGDPDEPLDDPTYPALDPQGNLWVPDGRHGRFQIFAPDGTLLEVWGEPGSAEGQFNFMEIGFGGYGQGAITFDADGNFYVVDTGNYRVQKFGSDRRFLTAWGEKGKGEGQFYGITDIAVDSQGRVYVIDAGRGDIPEEAPAIQVFDADGRFLAAWGEHGSGEGQLIDPIGLDIDGNGDVWVADFGNDRVQKFSPDGTFLTTWGEFGVKEGQFHWLTDVAIDSKGRIYVTDWKNNRVQVFAPNGQFLAAWGNEGKFSERQMLGPNSLVLDGASFVYVADVSNDTVQKYRLLPPLGP